MEITKICIVLRLHFLSELTLNTFIMDKKRVYTFGNGQAEGKADMRNLLGGKGANLAEMTPEQIKLALKKKREHDALKKIRNG